MILSNFISLLKEKDNLVEITAPCSPVLEITEITDRISKQIGGGKALLFSNNGTKFPLLINGYGSTQRMLASLHLENYEEFNERIKEIFKTLTHPPQGLRIKLKMLSELRQLSSYFPKQKKGRGACQDIIIKDPDLSILPILKCWPHDAGRFITLPMVHTKDPVTGILNVGMYRMQVMGSNLTGMHWHIHKTGARHYEEYKKTGRIIPVAVALGGDPVYAWCASAPLPDGINEYILAGFLRKSPVKMVKCITQDIEVPEDADIIIEGYVDPSEPLAEEGPFGDHTGFYSLKDHYPLFHVTCITHRKNAVYPATIVGIPPQEDFYMIEASEKIFLPLIQMTQLPEICDMHMPACGVAHNLVVVSIKNKFPGNAQKVIHSLWGAGQMMFNKVMIVVDNDIDIRNYSALIKAIAENTRLNKDIFMSSGASDALDHAADTFAYTGKIGIDATRKNNKNVARPILDLSLIPTEWQKNTELIESGIPVLLLNCISDSDFENNLVDVVREGNLMIVVCDFDTTKLHHDETLWYILANTDPERDITRKDINGNTVWLINAKSQKPKSDNTQWPDITVSDSLTIDTINKRWKEFGLGNIIASPSEKFRFISYNSALKPNINKQ